MSSGADRADDEELELTTEQRERIDRLFGQLPNLDLYGRLGIAHGADKKEIKRAYNERVRDFHPDRFFRKKIGAYKSKLEAIMVRMTEAHDVLCSPEHRAKYEAALRTQRASLIDDLLAEAAEELSEDDLGSQRVLVPDEGVVVTPWPPIARPVIPPAPPRESTIEMKAVTPPPRPPSSTTQRAVAAPSAMPLEVVVAQLKHLHATHKGLPLSGGDRARYEQLRNDLARAFVSAQKVAVRTGQTAWQAASVPCAVKLTVTVAKAMHRTLTIDLSPNGLSGLVGTRIDTGTPCEFSLELPNAMPIRGSAHAVSAAPYGSGSSTYRLVLTFDRVSASDRSRLEILLLDRLFSTMKL